MNNSMPAALRHARTVPRLLSREQHTPTGCNKKKRLVISLPYPCAVPASSGVTLPPLECLFTIEEEIGLIGAFKLDGSMVKGRKMLNLASNITVLGDACGGFWCRALALVDALQSRRENCNV